MNFNWVIFALRRFSRSKVNSIINVLGLSLGIFVFLIIFSYVKHEFSYDNFHTDADRIYSLVKEGQAGEDNYQGVNRYGVFPAPLHDVLKTKISGILYSTRITQSGDVVIETGGKTFYEKKLFAADADLFQILTFHWLEGEGKTMLAKPYTAAISKSMAIKLFGSNDAVGKVIEPTASTYFGSYTIEGVFEDFPTNSSYQFSIILNFKEFVNATDKGSLENWGNSNYNYLVKLNVGTEATLVGQHIKDFYLERAKSPNSGISTSTNYSLMPLRDTYLGELVNFSDTPRNDINRLYILATIAVFILVIAGINYVNLTTARALLRAKEVGIRKVSGAFQFDLVKHFLSETILTAILTLCVALVCVWLALPAFRNFIGKEIPFDITSPLMLFVGAMLILGIGFLAGIYPAVVLASFKPASVLKGSFSKSNGGSTLRDVLTTFQFAVSGGLIIAVIIVTSQLRYLETHDPGFDREQIITIRMSDVGVREKCDAMAEELRGNPNIQNVSIASYLPNSVSTQQGREWKSVDGKFDVSFYTSHVDADYLDLFSLELIAGRNFSDSNPNDKNAFIINETAAKTYGWEDPVGMIFTGENGGNSGDTVQIIGVLKDIHFASYRQPIRPFRLGYRNPWAFQMAIKVMPNDITSTLGFIEETYKKYATTKMPYTYNFFDEQFAKAYKSDRQLGILINVFSFLAVIIACLGLYGLAVHSTSQRLKEVGIRKVMGANIFQLTLMLNKRFFLIAVIAFALASPIAYYFMEQWLLSFAYHVEIRWVAFGAGLIALVMIAVGTVSTQTIRAAMANPIIVLRNE